MSNFTWDCSCGARNAASAAACPDCGRSPVDPSAAPSRPRALPDLEPPAEEAGRVLPFSASGSDPGPTTSTLSGFGQVPTKSSRPHPLLVTPAGSWSDEPEPAHLHPSARLPPAAALGLVPDPSDLADLSDLPHLPNLPDLRDLPDVDERRVGGGSALDLLPETGFAPLPGNGALLDLPPNGAPEPVPAEPQPVEAAAVATTPEPAVVAAAPAPAPKRRRRRRITPGLVVVVLFLIASLVVVGEVVAKSGNSAPPNPTQVTGP